MRVRDLDLRLTVTDCPVGEQPEKIECPAHPDDAASLAVYRDHIHCYGCPLHSTGFYALAYLLYGDREEQSVERAKGVGIRYTAQSVDSYRERVEQQVKLDPLPWGLSLSYNNLLFSVQRGERREWLYERGLTLDSINRFRLGHDGTRFTIPIYSAQGDLLTFRYRRDDFYGTHTFDPRQGKEVAIPKYSGVRGRNGLYLYPAEHLGDHEPEEVVVVEGELDAIRLWQEGIPAVSATNGAGAVAKLPQKIREEMPFIRHLYFACDADEPGQTAQVAGIQAARDAGFTSIRELWWPVEWGKDVTEVLLHHTWQDIVGEY